MIGVPANAEVIYEGVQNITQNSSSSSSDNVNDVTDFEEFVPPPTITKNPRSSGKRKIPILHLKFAGKVERDQPTRIHMSLKKFTTKKNEI